MFLEKILAQQYAEVARRKAAYPLATIFAALDREALPLRPFRERLTGNGIQVIAEVKKASPSKGVLCPDFQPERLAEAYERAGAAAISVLTEERFFQGSLENLMRVKTITAHPAVLRKDFIIDSYQLAEARQYGADAVLLIVAALEVRSLEKLLQEALALGMTPLVEVHHRQELHQALDAGAEVIGINNRNLYTFEVSLETTMELADEIPDSLVVVSESGIAGREDILRLQQAGVDGVLIGEALVTAADPEAALRQLLGGV